MANCNHRGASCIVGNFYTCPQRGCPNGPDAAGPNNKAHTPQSTAQTVAYGFWGSLESRDEILRGERVLSPGWRLRPDLPSPSHRQGLYFIRFTGSFRLDRYGYVESVDPSSLTLEAVGPS